MNGMKGVETAKVQPIGADKSGVGRRVVAGRGWVLTQVKIARNLRLTEN